jgi:hypothetical protein
MSRRKTAAITGAWMIGSEAKIVRSTGSRVLATPGAVIRS